jgi:hypothetical protein
MHRHFTDEVPGKPGFDVAIRLFCQLAAAFVVKLFKSKAAF